ncbi:FMN-dependent NADH-azoreductase [Granulicella arctica]|uniref:FMN-dependent NADH-azoreductase n=1 Tax=Granulicella arctica TaxID=940613 RepID=UPI0021DF76A0|nr:NAD(P)H-dependent oxidoreductase [Granulicella arctica]
MPTLLKIDVSPRGDYSVSRQLTKQFASDWQKAHNGTIVDRDLVKTNLPFVDLPWIAGAYSTPDQHTPEQKGAMKVSNDLIDELFAVDHIVIGTPMYNFSIPAILKAYIDHIVRVGRTYSPSYEGLVKGKKVTIIIASGGVYTPGSHLESYNVESSYLRQILGFIGLTDITFVLAGGTNDVNQGKISSEDFIASFSESVAEAAK